MSEKLRELHLSGELCEIAERKYGTRFGGLEGFLNFLLQEVTRDDTAEMDRAEQRVIEERLRELGYI